MRGLSKPWTGSVVFMSLLVMYVFMEVVSCTGLPKLILISMDGFRHNYLEQIPEKEVPNFNYFKKNGVRVKSVKNVFPSVTYPNHYSLITGLYPESHGVVHNRFYDPNLKTNFFYDTVRDNLDPLWYDVGAEPIYVTNNKAGQGRRSGSVLWPSGIGRVKCIGPDKVVPNANAFTVMNFTERVDYLIKWFTEEKEPINLGLLYFNEPDEIAHEYGPDSDEVRNFIKGELNSVLGYLMQELKAHGLQESMNIILTADHGFAKVTNYIALDEHVNLSYFNTGSNFQNSVVLHIYPNEGMTEKVHEQLNKVPSIQVYMKGHRELQDLHYDNNDRIAPIIVAAAEGTMIAKNNASIIKKKGAHGYNPNMYENMHPFFLAVGPAFKKEYVVDSIDSVDIYEMMCHILKLQPAPNNGSLNHVLDMLVEDSFVEITYTITGISFLILVGLTVCVAGLYTICACHNARKHRLLLPNRGSNSFRSSGVISLRSPEHHLLQSDEEDDDDEF